MATDNDKDIEVLKIKIEIMGERLDKLENNIFKKLDSIDNKLDNKVMHFEGTLISNKNSIEEKLEKEISLIQKDVESLKDLLKMGKGSWKILVIIGSLIAFIVALSKGILDILK